MGTVRKGKVLWSLPAGKESEILCDEKRLVIAKGKKNGVEDRINTSFIIKNGKRIRVMRAAVH